MAQTPLATSTEVEDLTEFGCYTFCAAQPACEFSFEPNSSSQLYGSAFVASTDIGGLVLVSSSPLGFAYLADGQCTCPTSFYTSPQLTYKANTVIVWDAFAVQLTPFVTTPIFKRCQSSAWDGGQCEAIQYTSDGVCYLTGTTTPCREP
jgi:hypothetical protein